MPTKHKRRWTEEEDKQLLFQWGTTKPKKLAELFGRTEVAIGRRAVALGLGSFARSAETISIRQFEEESGFSRSKIRAAMVKLKMHLHRVTTADPKFKSPKRQVALGEEQREKLLEYMLNTPISYLNTEGAGRSDAGAWGVGKKPAECLRCKLTARPHYAKGMCKYCYGVENDRRQKPAL